MIRGLLLLAVLTTTACGGVIHGRVFLDRDHDRIRDPDEPGVPDIAVFFERTTRTRTDASGDYIMATPYPLGVAWAWTPDGFIPGASYAHVLDADAVVDIPLAPSRVTPPPGPWTFAVASDTHLVIPNARDRWDGGVLHDVWSQMLAPAPRQPVFFTVLGDITQGTREPELDGFLASLTGIEQPFVPVAGNHDLYDAGHAWRRRWGPDGYAFDIGGIRVVVWNAFLNDALQLDFLHLVLDGEDPTARIIAMGHASPRDIVATEMAKLGIDVLFTGHWHANRRVDRFGLVEWGTEPLTMGGLDHTPAGYRVVTVDRGQVTTTARRTLLDPVLDLAAPRGCVGPGPVDVIANAAIDASTPIVTAGWVDTPASRITLVPRGGWAYRGALAPIGRARRMLELIATTPAGGTLEHRVPIDTCPPSAARAGAHTGMWPQVQGDATHTGASAAVVADLAPAWTTAVGGHVLAGSPIVVGDTVYVTVSDLGDGDHGGVVALALATGRERWRFTTAHPARSAPAVGQGVVVIADSGGIVVGVDAGSGRQRWRRDFAVGMDSWTWHLWQPPTIVGDTVYIGTQAELGAFDLRSGKRHWLTKFKRPRPWLGTSAAASAVGANLVFVANREDGLWLGDRTTGTEVKKAATGDFLGVGGAPVVTATAIFVGNSRGEVVAVDPATLDVVWRTKLVALGNDWSESIVGNLATSAGRVFAATQDGALVALDVADGSVLWRRELAARGPLSAVHYASDGKGYAASPVVTGDRVWLGGPAGELVAYAVADGHELERHALGAPVLAGIAPVDGGLVVATFAGTVHLLATPRPPAMGFPWQVLPAGLVIFVLALAGMRLVRRRR